MIADLHIHSRFSRATSRTLDPESLAFWAARKGISVVGTGDITHPGWLQELEEKLTQSEEGLFRLRPDVESAALKELPPRLQAGPRFMLTGEISCIYKKNGFTRKLHHLVLLPGLEEAWRLNHRLGKIGNLTSDGRPILGLDSRDLLEIVLEVSPQSFFIPAHIWTPWFSLFGSKSGFDSLEECFEDLSGHVHALETGLSSDPPMNRRLSALDRFILVSNSDAHSAAKLGREANIFETELSYPAMIKAITDGTDFGGTIEFYPEEGKYHLDGHRKCGARLEPSETRRLEGMCPRCGSPVTVGVLHRVEELADREEPVLQRRFVSLIPLPEILSEILSCGPGTKKVAAAYESLLRELGPELEILMETPLDEVERAGGPLLAHALGRMRSGEVIRIGGFDGEYGVIKLFRESEMGRLAGQTALFPQPAASTGEKAAPGPAIRIKRDYPRKHPGPEPAGIGEGPESGDPILQPLNPSQRQAVRHGRGHLLVTAGPGTGKTLTLTHRAAYMLRSEARLKTRILALAFTNKAAREMEERIRRLLGGGEMPVKVCTFHRFCLEILRDQGALIGLSPGFGICSESDSAIIAREAAGKRAADFQHLMPRIRLKQALGEEMDPPLADLVPAVDLYKGMLTSYGLVDLDGMELEALRLLKEHPAVCRELGKRYGLVFVDEYQDTNPAQAALLQALARQGGCVVCAIGDPDQAVYGFRGAEVENFYRFSKDFPGAGAVTLTVNYRSSNTILKGSAAVLGKAQPLQGVNGAGPPIHTVACSTHREEAEMVVEQIEKLLGGTSYFSMDSGRVGSEEQSTGVSFGDIAVLFRLNAQADSLEEALLRAGIPFARSGERPLTATPPASLVWRFLLALHRPESGFYREMYLKTLGRDRSEGERILESADPQAAPSILVRQAAALHDLEGSGDPPPALTRLKALADDFEGNLKDFLDSLSLERAIDHSALEGDRVALMSFHAAKGLEWPVVFLTGCEDGLTPLSIYGESDLDEERRLFYVALTRARERLILSRAARRIINGRALELPPSPFLERIPKDLFEPLQRGPWRPKSRQKQLSLFS
ncbi:MAG: UvrD-helicase domain-containing protein [Desulfobacteraceae bacterium]